MIQKRFAAALRKVTVIDGSKREQATYLSIRYALSVRNKAE
jgi:hypothetical protein